MECVLVISPFGTIGHEFLKELRNLTEHKICVLLAKKWHVKHYQKYKDQLEGLIDFEFDISAHTLSDQLHVIENHLDTQGLVPKSVIGYDDTTVLLAGKISDRYRLGWVTEELVSLYKSKHRLKGFLQENTSLRVNAFCISSQIEELLSFQQNLNKWPVVLKPIDAGGSWNVYQCHSEKDIQNAFQQITSAFNEYDESANKQVLLEEYIGGRLFAINGQTDKQGNIFITDCFEDDYFITEQNTFVFEGVNYFDPHDTEISEAVDYAVGIIKATGLHNAPFHLELKIDENGPCLIEATVRIAGAGCFKMANDIIEENLYQLTLKGYLNQLEFLQSVAKLSISPHVQHAYLLYGVAKKAGKVTAHHYNGVNNLPSFKGFDYLPVIGQEIEQTINVDTISYVAKMSHQNKQQLKKDVDIFRKNFKILIN